MSLDFRYMTNIKVEKTVEGRLFEPAGVHSRPGV